MTNPMNTGLTKNLLPLWTERELTDTETLELLGRTKNEERGHPLAHG